jgi:polar amino acid transport system substrate-binding protein/cystine transport system substrate-binding protein/membrane-bound lytic murein transglycosylase F
MRPHGLGRDALGALPILALLAAVYLLPPDTSLSQARAAGALRACMPPVDPPFVTGDAAAPGIDIEMLRALTRELGLTLAPVEEPAMTRAFNPSGWHLTRAACELVAGGLAASPMTRSFLETSPPYAETGWALLAPMPDFALRGRRIAVLAPTSGLDRGAAATYLRAQATQMVIVADADALVQGLRERRFEAAVTEKLLADGIAAREHWTANWLPGLPRYPVAFGLWKGDLTLKRAIVGAMDRLAREGTTATILMRYLGGAVRAGTG